jgi:acetylornithine deacetylase/succinyl-diaminopimelate desuccinylase family protein
MNGSIERVLRQIDENEIVEFVRSLIQAETVETEAPIIPLLERTMERMGMDVEVYDTCNPRVPEKKRPCLLGTLRGKSPKPLLCFNGHTDVVPVVSPSEWKHPPFKGVVEGSRLYGRGASDMKGGLGSMIMAVQALVKAKIELNGTLVIAAVPGEETGGWGTDSMIERGDWDAAIIGEPSELCVCPACNGITTFWVEVTGKSSHASMPEKGVNAIDKMLAIQNAFAAYKEKLNKKEHPYTGKPAFVSCIVQGGWRSVVVADKCRLHVTTHLIPGETTESRLSDVIEILEDLKRKDPELRCVLTDWEEKPIALPLPKTGPKRAPLDPTEIPVDEPIVQAMLKGAVDALGRRVPLGGVRYACDSPYFVNKKRVPALVFGPGNIEQAHTEDEWVDIKQLTDAAKVYAAGAMAFMGYS